VIGTQGRGASMEQAEAQASSQLLPLKAFGAARNVDVNGGLVVLGSERTKARQAYELQPCGLWVHKAQPCQLLDPMGISVGLEAQGRAGRGENAAVKGA